MNLQTRKLNMIQFLVNLKDEKILDKIESTINSSLSKKNESNNNLFTQEEIITRAEISNKQYQSGNFTNQNQLETDSKGW